MMGSDSLTDFVTVILIFCVLGNISAQRDKLPLSNGFIMSRHGLEITCFDSSACIKRSGSGLIQLCRAPLYDRVLDGKALKAMQPPQRDTVLI